MAILVMLGDERRECSVVTRVDGRVLFSNGDVRAFFNHSRVSLFGRDLYIFVGKDRAELQHAIGALAANVSIERDVMLRPRERKALVARVTISRADDTVLWQFATV